MAKQHLNKTFDIIIECSKVTIYDRVCRFVGQIAILGFCLAMIVLWLRNMGLTLW